MKTAMRFISITFLVSVLALGLYGNAVAQNPHLASADTYTDSANATINHGSDIFLLLSASNLAGCTPVTNLWYKFDIPNYASTIGTANLYLTFESFTTSNSLDMELRSSADTTWSETALTYSNQPSFESTVLATASSIPAGGTAVFSGATLANYISSHRGQSVSFIIRANCSGTVASPSANRGTRTNENTSGSGVYLDLFTPNAVSLASLTGASTPLNSLGMAGLSAAVIALMTLLFFVRRRWHSA
jgi:hypothetical protein